MGTYHLIAHPETPPSAVSTVDVRWIETAEGKLMLRWQVGGCKQLVVPAFGGKGRADGLWQTTCFELFVMTEGQMAYDEFNFSPSERWAAYRFDDYRAGMRELDMAAEPLIAGVTGEKMFMMTVTLDAFPRVAVRVALSAVIEETDGTKSYWALAHPPKSHKGGKPDFHHPTCFTIALPPPESP